MKMLRAQFGKAQRRRKAESGYVLLTMLLMVALMAIVAMTVMVPLKFEMQRDREEEMIHRGVQYTRAIRLYYKKYGRYPTRLEDLENTNNLRYLRKRYKDPMNHNQDFRLLHYGEPGVTMGGAIGGGIIPGANPIGGQGLNAAAGSAFGGSSGFGNNSAFGNSNSGFGNSNSAFGNSNSGFGNSNSAFGNNSNSAFGSNAGVNPNGAFAQPGSSDQASSNGSQTPGQAGTNPDSSQPGGPNSGTTTSSGQSNGFSGSSGQPIASGPIVGVASVSKDPTIRLYNKKTKYNEWQFLYDPSIDTGGLIKTPYQPALTNFMAGGQGIGQPVNGQPGQNGNTSTFGGGSSFGSSGSSFGSSGSSFGGSSFGSGASSFGSSGSSFGSGSGFGSSGSSGPTPPPEPPPTPPQQ